MQDNEKLRNEGNFEDAIESDLHTSTSPLNRCPVGRRIRVISWRYRANVFFCIMKSGPDADV